LKGEIKMYCKKCGIEMEYREIVCRSCGFDNSIKDNSGLENEKPIESVEPNVLNIKKTKNNKKLLYKNQASIPKL
jgi:hypothetical protein